MEDLEEVDIARVLAEVLLEEEVYSALEEKRVVHCDRVDALDAEPARLTPAGNRLVHHVVRYEEEGL